MAPIPKADITATPDYNVIVIEARTTTAKWWVQREAPKYGRLAHPYPETSSYTLHIDPAMWNLEDVASHLCAIPSLPMDRWSRFWRWLET